MADMTFDDLQHMLWSFAEHRVLTVAARTGILRRLASSGATPEEVAHDLDLNSYSTGKVLRALHALGVLIADDHIYRVTDGLSEHFREGPGDLAPFLAHSHSMYEGWGENLEPWLRGEAWDTGPRDPEGVRRFGSAMRALGSKMARRVAARLDLEGVDSALDVGGGFGHYAMALCSKRPGLRATVVDIPPVAQMASLELEGSEFEDRIRFLGGDYLETDYGTSYDLALIANILHQENPTRAAELVRRAAAAVVPGGRVAVVDFQIDEAQREHRLGALFAINMRSFGDTHTESSIRGWMSAAGLESITRTDIDRHRWLIIGHRPPTRSKVES